MIMFAVIIVRDGCECRVPKTLVLECTRKVENRVTNNITHRLLEYSSGYVATYWVKNFHFSDTSHR